MKTRYVVIAAVISVIATMAVLFAVLSPKTGATSAAASPEGRAALARENVPAAGNPDAKVHIVEFLDPACETCREFYPLVKGLMAANPDRVRLSVRYVAFHKGSDFVVKALLASKKQGKYWQTLETLLASQPTWVVQHTVQPDRVWAQLAPVGLDLDRLMTDMGSAEVAAAMAADAEDARVLKVVQTPEYFVNGRSMPTFGSEQLQRLVADAVAGAYP